MSSQLKPREIQTKILTAFGPAGLQSFPRPALVLSVAVGKTHGPTDTVSADLGIARPELVLRVARCNTLEILWALADVWRGASHAAGPGL